ncbi:hypothetical protein EDB81DRAFT_863404 [Dactylonectria macrodidyma]|uniref:Uncharacterized protein n=1 Tax=Dactylonectria macrodidyma TaxID=307937 RepID=A0A9P9CXW1_9HYPO|nr:hypothetical protein EDB81DRAFT_863404 [Dactylonectria macrodidyma]
MSPPPPTEAVIEAIPEEVLDLTQVEATHLIIPEVAAEPAVATEPAAATVRSRTSYKVPKTPQTRVPKSSSSTSPATSTKILWRNVLSLLVLELHEEVKGFDVPAFNKALQHEVLQKKIISRLQHKWPDALSHPTRVSEMATALLKDWKKFGIPEKSLTHHALPDRDKHQRGPVGTEGSSLTAVEATDLAGLDAIQDEDWVGISSDDEDGNITMVERENTI